ncbi:unnamed protein product [Microthlaspi erraticum]|uniref:MADS-box domain-containing protein n=1 Tax=Microthlaspi erraticum TaxID=1685480 RepID=A0A6D2JMT6_9BRAS|nr:unnamed protein product [Microthlaspi erraticum]
MSTKQTKEKQTKGKQKIEIKKVESYGDRMITFSKRRSGIFKKMNEISTLCDVESAFLVYSQAGKPYSFSHPSMNQVAIRLNNPSRQEPSAKDDNKTMPLFEAYKRKKIEELMKIYVERVDEFAMLKEMENMLMESIEEQKLDNMWWNIPLDGLSMEDLELRHQTVVELHDTVAQSQLGKDGGGHCGCDGA